MRPWSSKPKLVSRIAALAVALAGAAALGRVPARAQVGDPALVGQWAAPLGWPISPIHASMLPTGRVLFHGETAGTGQLRIWNPADSSLTSPAEPGYNLFCAAHTFTGDGRLFYTGGQFATYNQNPDDGLATAKYYDPFTNTWTGLPNMSGDRWYPTNTMLANGDILVLAGGDAVQGTNLLPQVWQVGSGTWRNLTGAQMSLPYYPETFLAPNGRVFLADFTSRYLDTAGTGAWSTVGNMSVSGRNNYGCACVYEPGKILFAGGADPPTETAEVIDLNQPAPAWRQVASMAFKRRQNNLTLLPDGKVLVTGGSQGPGFDNTSASVFAAELWDPATETWSTLASAQRHKGYHSFGLLLPSGKVLTGGQSGWHGEVYSPPYLFKGAQPTTSSAPDSVNYGQVFFVGTPDGASIADVTMVRLSSVTHSINMGQWFNRLSFSAATGGLNVTAPASGNVCPPGYYMLFVLNGSGVPSVARFVRVSGLQATVPTAPSGLTATAVSRTRINLAWTDNASDETGFRVERSSDGANFTQIASPGANVTTYASTGLRRNRLYYFRVRAYNGVGNSAYSNVASARTKN